MMGTPTTDAMSNTQRSAMGLRAGPEIPPVSLASTGAPDSASISMPGMVLMAVIASAPASTTARAISPISCTLGDSFTRQGSDVTFLTVAVTSAAADGEAANISPCSAPRFGQDTFSSIMSGLACASSAAACAKPSAVSAERLAMSGTRSGRRRRDASRSSSSSSVTPGLGSPMAFISPCPQSTAVGFL